MTDGVCAYGKLSVCFPSAKDALVVTHLNISGGGGGGGRGGGAGCGWRGGTRRQEKN